MGDRDGWSYSVRQTHLHGVSSAWVIFPFLPPPLFSLLLTPVALLKHCVFTLYRLFQLVQAHEDSII